MSLQKYVFLNIYTTLWLIEAQEQHDGELLSRLREIANALLSHKDKTAEDILGKNNSLRVNSCMTLFNALCPNDVFDKVINQFYNGKQCEKTLDMLNRWSINKIWTLL